EKNTLQLVEGHSSIYSIRLQNPDSYELRVKIDYDKGFMQAIGFKDEYVVQPGETLRIEFNITAPKYKKGENILPLSYTVHQLSGDGGSGVGFSPKISNGFKLEVLKSPDRFYIDPLHIVFAAMALVFFLFIYRKNIINLVKNRNRVFPKRKFNAFKSRKIIKWKR
ncbi:MAG: hypothetical protein AABX63_03925, partial [Nanoarchaeota archaeon]